VTREAGACAAARDRIVRIVHMLTKLMQRFER